jgi:hypothetical protein
MGKFLSEVNTVMKVRKNTEIHRCATLFKIRTKLRLLLIKIKGKKSGVANESSHLI